MQQFVRYKNIEIGYSVSGKGNTLVFLHGFLETSSMWDAFVTEFSKTHKVITIDLLGHGKTGCIGLVHSIENMANAVKAVLKHLKIKRSYFIGHSLGAYVALAFAENEFDAVKGLCLINASINADSPARIKIRNRVIEAAKTNYKAIINIAIENSFCLKSRSRFKNEIKALKKKP